MRRQNLLEFPDTRNSKYLNQAVVRAFNNAKKGVLPRPPTPKMTKTDSKCAPTTLQENKRCDTDDLGPKKVVPQLRNGNSTQKVH